MAVVVESGPLVATLPLYMVPQSQWLDLMRLRRSHLRVRLGSDCRCLVEFVDDAEKMYAALGFEDAADMVRRGYELSPEEVDLAVEWLRLNPPADPVPIDVALRLAQEERARKARELYAKDQKNRRPAHIHIDRDVYGEETDVHVRPAGNRSDAALRRLEAKPGILKRVLAGELTAHAGMIEAGFRKPRKSRRKTTLDKIMKLVPLLSNSERDALIEHLGGGR